MSPVVDETAGDLPVKEVGLTRGGLMPSGPDSVRDVKPWKKPQIMTIKDRQRLFRVPRDHLEDQCLRLQEENIVLRQHARTQELRLRRMSTRLLRLQEGSRSGGPETLRERDAEATVQALETRVAALETQKATLQGRLSLARQHLLDLGGPRHYRPGKGRGADGEGGVRRAAQTAPARYGATLDDPRGEMERLHSLLRSGALESQRVQVVELEAAVQALRDKLVEKERGREVEETEEATQGARRQQAHAHRLTIRDNVDLIRLQKQLTEKNTALRVTQEKFHDLQEAYEHQLEESQRVVQESQGALLGRLDELKEELSRERGRSLDLEGQLASASLTSQTLHELQERISDLEGEKCLLKESYDTLLQSTLSATGGRQDHQHGPTNDGEEIDPDGNDDVWKKRRREEEKEKKEVQRQEEVLRLMVEERRRLEEEKERLQGEKEALEGRRDGGRGSTEVPRERHDLLQQELQLSKEQVSFLQKQLDSVSQAFDMSVEDLSETLLQIKAFRLQQESRQGLVFLEALGGGGGGGGVGDPGPALAEVQAAHAETVLELHKTRELLLLEHRISNGLQGELDTVNHQRETEREESRRRVGEKDKLLSKRALQINTLQAQLKELAYSPKNYKRSIPIQYTWPGGDQEVVQPIEDDTSFSQLRPGESMLEIHLKAATFTPGGLRALGALGAPGQDPVTFCTYTLPDHEVHCTPLVSGPRPGYGFTTRHALPARQLARLGRGGVGAEVRVELHQAVGGVRFSTLGGGPLRLAGAVERRGEQLAGGVKLTGPEGDIVGVVDYWVRLHPPAEPVDREPDRTAFRGPASQTGAKQLFVGWQDIAPGELLDYGGGIPNELVVSLERCVGLSARWPGLLPDAYLTYRFYDLPPHASPTVRCCADPAFDDAVSYPLAITADVMQYLSSSSLWVYVFDDGEDVAPPVYLAKTPVPLRGLAAGRDIRGDYVLRDAAGGPRGMVRVLLKWRYPFQPPGGATGTGLGAAWPQQTADRGTEPYGQHGRGPEEGVQQRETWGRTEGEEVVEEVQRPVAKPRVKIHTVEPRETAVPISQSQQRPTPVKLRRRPQERAPLQPATAVTSSSPTPLPTPSRKRTTKRSPPDHALATPTQRQATPSGSPARRSERTSSQRLEPSGRLSSQSAASSVSDARSQGVGSLEQGSLDQEELEVEERVDSEAGESSGSSSSDAIVVPLRREARKGDKLRVEILSLTFGPSSEVARDQSVQRVYVEYRLLGVPMASTETPVSLRKPAQGEEIHYNFTRVIYVDGSQSAPLRQYLYTMLEGTDPSQGRLKFTVVSEPMDEEEECVDVGHAFLDLQELLLTGNDVIERQIEILSVDQQRDTIGKLKVSLEAAKALTGIYREFHGKTQPDNEGRTTEEEEDHSEERKEKKKPVIHVDDYDEDSDSF